MMNLLRCSVLLSCLETSYPSVPLNWSVSADHQFQLPEHWQFPDYSTNHNLQSESSSSMNIFDVMHGDQPMQAEGSSEVPLRYPQTRSCSSRRNSNKKKNTLFGTAPTFKTPRDKMQTYEVGYYGHRLELRCPFKKGCPRALALWYKNGVEVKRAAGDERRPSRVYISKSGETLTIEDNRVEDDGNYTCVIRNMFGSIQHTIKVQSTPRHVAAPPNLYKDQPGNQTVVLGTSLTLLCQLTFRDPGAPANIKWYKHYQVNGSYIDSEGKVYIRKLQDSLTLLEGDDQELHLTNVTLEDAGWYTCLVTNQFDTVVSTGYVEVVQEEQEQEERGQEWPPIKWLLVVSGGVLLLLFVLVAVLCTKYHKEKRQKVKAVQNAQCVARWTKKVFIERRFALYSGEGGEGTLSPTVRVEKVLTSPSHWLGEEEEDLYEFQLDEKWEFPRDLLELREEIGAGAFGRVFRGTAHKSVFRSGLSSGLMIRSSDPCASITVAVKMMKDQSSEQEVLNLVKEIEIMKAVGGHENIVNLLGACTQPVGQPLMAILEYAEHGNLRDYLRTRRGHVSGSVDHLENKPVTTKEMIRFAYQVARGMEFLAQRRCVHRDLAARNVLVARGKVAKVADFGLARDVEQTNYYRRVTDGKLPVLWMSPESLFEGISTTKSDVWSYGVLLWEIITCGERPYTGIATEALLELIREGWQMSIPLQCPQELYQMMKSCWHLKPSCRPDWALLVSSLHSLHTNTRPGLYLNLSLPTINTPPSSPDSPRYNNVVRVRPRERTNTNTREGIDGIAPLEMRRVSTESGYSSSTRQQEGELEKELEYANIFQPSAPVMTSDAENTEME